MGKKSLCVLLERGFPDQLPQKSIIGRRRDTFYSMNSLTDFEQGLRAVERDSTAELGLVRGDPKDEFFEV